MALEMWKKKAGPLPMWGWGGILLGGALLYSLVQRSRQAKTADDTSSQPTDTSTVPSDQVPDFISQVYTTVNNTPTPTATPPPATTLPAPVTNPPVAPPKTTTAPRTPAPVTGPPKVAAKATSYKVKTGDTLSSIAKKYGTTWQALFTYNTTPGVRPADTIKTLKARGPNLLYSGETILIPPKK